MSNIFKNANRTVERYSCIKQNPTKIDYASDTYLANTKLRELNEASKSIDFDADMERMAKDYNKKKSRGDVVRKSIYESQVDIKFDQMSKECRTNLFKNILFEVLYNALPLDADFCKEHAGNIKYLIDGYVNDNNGFALLESSSEKTNSILLKRMEKICKRTTDNVIRSRLLESKCKEDIVDIDFSLTDDEKKDFDMSKSELDLDKVSDLVKKKVLTVIKDEKQREEAEGQIREKIEEEIQKDLTDKMDEKITKSNADGEEEKAKADEFNENQDDLHEALSRIVVHESPVEKGTLFNALMRSTYREILHENIAIQDDVMRDDDRHHDFNAQYDVNYSMKDEFRSNNSFEDDDEDDAPVERREINMDLILAETITKYTLMEMLYTLKLEDYSYTNINKLTERLLNDTDDNMSIVTESSKDNEDNKTFFVIKGKFFKIFNNIKNKKDIDKSKKDLLSLVEDTDESDRKQFKNIIEFAIKEMDSVCDKNPHMKKHCDDVIEWLKGEFTDAVEGKSSEPEESDEDKEIKEMWNKIF